MAIRLLCRSAMEECEYKGRKTRGRSVGKVTARHRDEGEAKVLYRVHVLRAQAVRRCRVIGEDSALLKQGVPCSLQS